MQRYATKPKSFIDGNLPLKVGVVSLGCPKNLTDTEVMMGLLSEQGYQMTTNEADADVLLLNTCAFLKASRDESKKHILELAEHKKTGKCRHLIVAGCLPQKEGKAVLDEFPQVDGIIGSGSILRVAELMEKIRSGQKGISMLSGAHCLTSPEIPVMKATLPFTAYVKISDGCNHKCAFCTIPSIRGLHRSKPMEIIEAEIRNLVEKGVKEVSLIAQDSTYYGLDLYKKQMLAELLRRLGKIEGLRWIRIMYAYPSQVTDELIDVMAGEEKVCKYLDLPLQHASDTILKRMRRGTTRKSIETLLARLRSKMPEIAIRSTFIVGFPGETQEDIAQLIDFLSGAGLAKVGCFTYSREEGTPSWSMGQQVPEAVSQERLDRVMQKQNQISQALNEQWMGRTLNVLVEAALAGGKTYKGRSYREAPEIDGSILLTSEVPVKAGEFVPVEVTRAFAYDLVGHTVF